MIHFNQVTVHNNGQALFQDISFFLPKASYTCMYGEDDSGKSTLLRMIAGEVPPDQGNITVNSMELQSLPADRLPYFRRQVGWVESEPVLLENLSTTANVNIPLEIAGLDKRAKKNRTEAVLEQLGLSLLADVAVRRLTTDQRWLVACARAAVHKPAVLLIDEPQSAISEATATRQQELTEHLTLSGTTTVVVTNPATLRLATVNVGRLELTQGRAFYHEYTGTAESHQ